MKMEELKISLPPPGLLLRECIKTCIYFSPAKEVFVTGGNLILKSGDILSSLRDGFNLARRVAVREKGRFRQQGRKFTGFPLTGNDRRGPWASLLERLGVRGTPTVDNAIDAYCRMLDGEVTLDELNIAFSRYEDGYPFEKDRYSILSALKPEHYEFSRTPGYMTTKKMEIRLGSHSLLLGVAGYILARVGFTRVGAQPGDRRAVLLSPVDPGRSARVHDIDRLINTIDGVRVSGIPGTEPVEALSLWFGYHWRNALDIPGSSSNVNVFIVTEAGRNPASVRSQHTFELKHEMAFFYTLFEKQKVQEKDWLEKRIVGMLREALRYNAKEKAFASRFVKLAHRLIHGSAQPADFLYWASRDATQSLKGGSSQRLPFVRRIAPQLANLFALVCEERENQLESEYVI